MIFALPSRANRFSSRARRTESSSNKSRSRNSNNSYIHHQQNPVTPVVVIFLQGKKPLKAKKFDFITPVALCGGCCRRGCGLPSFRISDETYTKEAAAAHTQHVGNKDGRTRLFYCGGWLLLLRAYNARKREFAPCVCPNSLVPNPPSQLMFVVRVVQLAQFHGPAASSDFL